MRADRYCDNFNRFLCLSVTDRQRNLLKLSQYSYTLLGRGNSILGLYVNGTH